MRDPLKVNISWMCCLLLLWTKHSLGEFQDPALVPVSDPEPDGVVVDPSGNSVSVEEMDAIPSEDLDLPLRIAKIMVTGSEPITIEDMIPPTTKLVVEESNEEWFLVLNEALDYEDVKSYVILLKHGTLKSITINVVDLNDSPVEIRSFTPLNKTYPELKDLSGDPITTVVAEDPDQLDNGKLRFELQHLIGEGEDGPTFRIDSASGELSIIKQLDYKEAPMHRLELWVFDSDDKHNDSIIVTVDVEDLPNLPPEWIDFPAIKTVEENTPLTSVVHKVVARDGDLLLKWPIEFSMVEEHQNPEIEDYFLINPTNGEITVRREIDAQELFYYAEDLSFSLRITAREKAPAGFPDFEELEITNTTIISIRDINNNPPEVCPIENPTFLDDCKNLETFSVQISEDASGTLELDKPFFVRDLDPTLQFSKYIAAFAPNTDEMIKAAFEIQPTRESSGVTEYSIVVKDRSKLDYEGLEGFWWEMDEDEVPQPKPAIFDIIITESESGSTATAQITVTVNDVNDNPPIFQQSPQYEFYVCENLDIEDTLETMIPHSTDPMSRVCREATSDGTDIRVFATDADISPRFSAVSYRWYEASRLPPLDIDITAGTMVVNKDPNFDYDRFDNEIFIVEATDSELVSNIPVKFNILDKNDLPVDLVLPYSRFAVKENTTYPNGVIFSGIIARDDDVIPNITMRWELVSLFHKEQSGIGYKQILDINDDIEQWFTLDWTQEPGTANRVNAILKTGPITIDREGGGDDGDVDRVDIIIFAADENTERGDREVSQGLTLLIDDINDEWPQWEDITGAEVEAQIQETEYFEGDDDPSTPAQREIYTFRARDPDKTATFHFSITTKEGSCIGSEEICAELLGLVTLTEDPNPAIGKAILRRTQGEKIDREETKYYGIETDSLLYTVFVTDEDDSHAISLDIKIAVEDINDNTPEWADKYHEKEYTVDELVQTGIEIGKFNATDLDRPDKFGNVNYILLDTPTPNNGFDQFNIDLQSGSLTAIPGQYEWSEVKEYSLTVRAIDNYRPGTTTGSEFVDVVININVLDDNNHPPEFMTDPDTEGYVAKIPETWPQAGEPLNTTILVRDLDDPSKGNGEFVVVITKVFKDKSDVELDPIPFRVGELRNGNNDQEKNVEIVPTLNLTGEWGDYDLVFEATDRGTPDPLSSPPKTYTIKIENENLHAPVFDFPSPDGDTKILISINLMPGRLITWNNITVRAVSATDQDNPETGNGRVTYTAVQHEEDETDGFEYFGVAIHGGEFTIELKKVLDPNGKSVYTSYIRATDGGDPQRFSEVIAKIYIVPSDNRPPYFPNNTAMDITIMENIVGELVEISEAYDEDSELEDNWDPEVPGFPPIEIKIYYHLVGGYKESFQIVQDENNKTYITTIEPLDREYIPRHQVVVYVSNDEEPPTQVTPPEEVDPNNLRFLLINIEVGNEFDTYPEFGQGVISGGFSAINRQDEAIATIPVTDLDDDDEITFRISSEFTPSDPSLNVLVPFKLEPVEPATELAVRLILLFTPQPNMRGFYTFNITATDLGSLSTTIQCKIYMIKESNVVTFKFLNRREEIESKSSQLAAVLTEAFIYRCNIDRTQEEVGSFNSTIVLSHFIDLADNEPIPASYIEEQQFIPEVYTRLQNGLTTVGIILAPDGIGNRQTSDSNTDRMIIYILIGGVGIMAVVLLILGTTCYFNNRSLSRRVRALTATTFGSQMSGLNRTGAALDLPNTNEFAIEGSNPMWTTNPSDKKVPAFDAESVGSGGSVLIGVEDDDDFKNYKSTDSPSNPPPYDAMDEDDDLYENSGNRNRNALYQSDSPDDVQSIDGSDDGDGGGNFSFGGPGRNLAYEDGDSQDQIEPPPYGLGTTSMRRNPLMNLGFDDDE